jgi:hypothetical protein
MKTFKSERLKKLEAELTDLEQWLKLGLVPKKELTKHKQEISELKSKIEEEKERIQFLKESGDYEEYAAPKKGATRAGYTEMPSIPDIDMGGDAGYAGRDSHYEMTTEQTEGETTYYEERDEEESVAEKGEATQFEEEDEEEESYFSDRARWRRGGIQDPDQDAW